MGFELFCMVLIGLLFATAVVFGGYRLFLFLLPIWGFFFGFGLGAQTLQVLFGEAFLATITSWIVGLIVGILFAVLSYLFYFIAVALLAGSFGYGLTVGLLAAIGLDFGFIVWILGIVVGIIVAVLVIAFNVQKYAIIVITAVGGTAAMIYVLLAAFGNLDYRELLGNPVMSAIQDSFWWLIFFAALSIAGIVVQLRANRAYDIESYNRFAETM